jgi:hypothetical protein
VGCLVAVTIRRASTYGRRNNGQQEVQHVRVQVRAAAGRASIGTAPRGKAHYSGSQRQHCLSRFSDRSAWLQNLRNSAGECDHELDTVHQLQIWVCL